MDAAKMEVRVAFYLLLHAAEAAEALPSPVDVSILRWAIGSVRGAVREGRSDCRTITHLRVIDPDEARAIDLAAGVLRAIERPERAARKASRKGAANAR